MDRPVWEYDFEERERYGEEMEEYADYLEEQLRLANNIIQKEIGIDMDTILKEAEGRAEYYKALKEMENENG